MSSTSHPATPQSSSQSINHPAHALLSRGHSAEVAATIFTEKIKNKPLLLHPSHTTTTHQDKRALRRHIRHRKAQYHIQHARPRPLSAKEKRDLNLLTLPPEEVKYSIYKRLNGLWRGYILEVLNVVSPSTGEILPEVLTGAKTVTAASCGSLLASADFHGMEVEVIRAKDVGRVGLKGIVVRETRSTFLIVTKEDRCTRILKKGCIFRVKIDLVVASAVVASSSAASSEPKPDEDANGESDLPTKPLVFDLHGSQLEIRPVERAVRKFKWRSMDDL